MKRALIVTLVTVTSALFGLYTFRNDIALALFEQNITRQVSWDLRADLAPGIHVAFCGTGTPLPDPGRGGACTAVIANNRIYLFDAGEGAAESLALMGIMPADIEAVFLTHFHSDHINGLGALALQHVFRGGVAAPLPVYGGPGVERVVNGFNEAFAQDHSYRVAHHGQDAAPAAGFQLGARPLTVPASGSEVIMQQDGVSITAFEVEHESVWPAYGYRISDGTRSVVISGDTAYSSNLVDNAKGTDLLVHEALAPKLVARIRDTARQHFRDGLAVVMNDIPSYHASPADAVRSANAAAVPMTFAQRLLHSGVPCEFRIYPGAYHASEVFAPEAELSKRIWAGRIEALKRFIAA